MKKRLLTTAITLALAAPAFAGGTHGGGHGDEMDIGRPGDDHHATRTVEISMLETDDGEMLFEPRNLEFVPGETVKLIITNNGELEHEFVMDTYEENEEHKAMMAKFDMEHDDPNSARLEPGQTAEIVWTFSNEGRFQFACLIPGHYESGMHGALDVGKRGS
ncbi:cupredoxin domain-containing protein [Sedimentitalea todarodis]|uniref:cupredoxin domain-containing protein n=1 Tax=Sedimentitalea todarodis TaxID=1631240 RepID=UPI00292DDEE2|nr:cupredoxin family protein [Sedimentitalea todarodis]